MKAAKGCMAVLVVVLATGCLEKPALWVPGDGLLEDAPANSETMGGEGGVSGDLADLGGSELAPDADVPLADVPDGDSAPEDKVGPEAGELAELEVMPDADVPPVEAGPPVLVPGVFAGRSSGGEFTLVPVGPGGLVNGATMTGGKWTMSNAELGMRNEE